MTKLSTRTLSSQAATSASSVSAFVYIRLCISFVLLNSLFLQVAITVLVKAVKRSKPLRPLLSLLGSYVGLSRLTFGSPLLKSSSYSHGLHRRAPFPGHPRSGTG